METLRLLLRIVHIGLGFIGLVAFWIPVFAKKGGPVHLRFGKIFVWCAYGVAGSAGVSVVMHLTMMTLEGMRPGQAPNNFSFLILLGYLALITFVTIRFSVGTARTKQRREAMRTPFFKSAIVFCVLGSLTVIATALLLRPGITVLLLFLSLIGFMMAWDIHAYLYKPPKTKRDWFYMHMGNMLGGGIAFHTAFAVFGFSRITGLHLEGMVAMIPWVLPLAVGLPGAWLWERKYRIKFGDLPGKGKNNANQGGYDPVAGRNA